jgi:hypothetical protein
MLPIQWHRETGAVLPLPLRCLGLGLPTATLARYFCPRLGYLCTPFSLFASFLLCTIGLSVYPGSLPPSFPSSRVGSSPSPSVVNPSPARQSNHPPAAAARDRRCPPSRFERVPLMPCCSSVLSGLSVSRSLSCRRSSSSPVPRGVSGWALCCSSLPAVDERP